MKYYFKYIWTSHLNSGPIWILLFGLGVALTPSPPMDRILEGFVRIYYPLVMLVGRLGNFKGDANIIRPILLGVPLGIVIYGIVLGVVIGYFKNSIHSK